MTKNLLIVFVKNNEPGHVKTRLAKSIGDHAAAEVYQHLVRHTLDQVNQQAFDTHIYYSSYMETPLYPNFSTYVQKGDDLGARMRNAFNDGFEAGYDHIVLIGSDLPDLSAFIIRNAFDELEYNDVVIGPAEDGGYYLIGLSSLISSIFDNKPWSSSNLLELTLNELKVNKNEFSLLDTLNDIDTFEDLQRYPKFLNVISKHGKIRK